MRWLLNDRHETYGWGLPVTASLVAPETRSDVAETVRSRVGETFQAVVRLQCKMVEKRCKV